MCDIPSKLFKLFPVQPNVKIKIGMADIHFSLTKEINSVYSLLKSELEINVANAEELFDYDIIFLKSCSA